MPATAPARPRPSRAVELAEAAAWSQAVLRRFASATNRSLASTDALVVGAGPIGSQLASRLVRIGARVVVSSADAVALLALAGSGIAVRRELRAAVAGRTALVVVTGEEPRPLDAADFAPGDDVVVVDAALPGTASGLSLAAGPPARPGVATVLLPGRRAFLVTVGADAAFEARRAEIGAARDRLLAADQGLDAAELDARLAAELLS